MKIPQSVWAKEFSITLFTLFCLPLFLKYLHFIGLNYSLLVGFSVFFFWFSSYKVSVINWVDDHRKTAILGLCLVFFFVLFWIIGRDFFGAVLTYLLT